MLLVEPSGEKSGVEVINADQLNAIYIQNTKLRRAYYLIQRLGYVDGEGVFIEDPSPSIIKEGEVPMLPAFDSLGSYVSSITEDYYNKDSLVSESDSSLFTTKTEITSLPIHPEGARRTHYRVVVLTAGDPRLSYDENVYDSLRESHKAMITGFQPQNLAVQALLIDYLLPLFLAGLGQVIEDEVEKVATGKGALMASLMGELIGIVTTDLPGIVTKLQGKDGNAPKNYSIVDALQEIRRNHLFNTLDAPPWVELSGFSRDVLTALLKWFAYEVLDVKSGEALLDFIEGKVDGGMAPGDKKPRPEWLAKVPLLERVGAASVMSLMSKVDLVLNLLSRLRLLYDVTTSAQLEAFDVKVLEAKVRLRPTPIEVDIIDDGHGSSIFTVTADVVDSVNEDGKEKAPITFDWECSAKYGHLYAIGGMDRTDNFTSSRDYPSAKYISSGTANGSETDEYIKVTAFFGGVNDPNREEIGSFKEQVWLRKRDTYALEPFGADDIARIWLNGKVLYYDPDGSYAGTRGGFSFKAKPGDQLRIMIADWWGYYASGGPFTLKLPDGSTRLLAAHFSYTTPAGNHSVVFDQTFTI